jgi:ABC-type nickel/cobalt efflux system permease component RcnA
MHTLSSVMPALPVIPLMLVIGLCLVFTFVIFFIREQSRRFQDAERESLLPLNEESPRVGTAGHEEHEHEHVHEHGTCGCRSGRHAPCPGCLKRHAITKPR